MNNTNELIGDDLGKMHPKKILFISNLPTPYQLDFFDEIADHHNILAIFLWKKSRGWAVNKQNRLTQGA